MAAAGVISFLVECATTDSAAAAIGACDGAASVDCTFITGGTAGGVDRTSMRATNG